MKHRITISDFAKLNGCTIKTVLYYHKIGLLPEPQRSKSGYRVYGPNDMVRMQSIRHLKTLGLDSARIKDVLGKSSENQSLKSVLESLKNEIISEQEQLGKRLALIEQFLADDSSVPATAGKEPESFRAIAEILGQERIDAYARTSPGLFIHQQRVFGIFDAFQWGRDYREIFKALASYFKEHPEQYETVLEFGARLSKVVQLPEDSPEIEILARESVDFIKENPQLEGLLNPRQGIEKPLEELYNDMVTDFTPPSQARFNRLFKQYLSED